MLVELPGTDPRNLKLLWLWAHFLEEIEQMTLIFAVFLIAIEGASLSNLQ